jgi:UDP-GlcNAc3NAcA epimerase
VKFVTVVGARPQFIKATAVSHELRAKHTEILVHTGQHYDEELSGIFFSELGLPAPDHMLDVGSGSHGEQTGAMLRGIERVLISESPDAVLVYGDTNSTLAGALAAAKLKIPVAHVEAGLRSFNRDMPEEINRIVTDHLARWLFAPSETARRHLEREGIADGVHVVGDVMLDAIQLFQPRAERSQVLERLKVRPKQYLVATIHRAENSDDLGSLSGILEGLALLEETVILPLHPRTRKTMDENRILVGPSVRAISPLGYIDMLALERNAACVLTDSGGMQKEAYWLGVPCITLRNETEWPETVATGWNVLVGHNPAEIVASVQRSQRLPELHPDLYGNGTAGKQIAAILERASGA